MYKSIPPGREQQVQQIKGAAMFAGGEKCSRVVLVERKETAALSIIHTSVQQQA